MGESSIGVPFRLIDIVTKYKEEWNRCVVSEKNKHYAFAYVWNKDDDWCSEFGTVVVQSFGGGIKRIG